MTVKDFNKNSKKWYYNKNDNDPYCMPSIRNCFFPIIPLFKLIPFG